jgi:hypothetical protein
MGLSVILAGGLLWESSRSASKLPEVWRKTQYSKEFRLSIWFLMTYLFLNLVSEIVATYLAYHQIYNSFVYSISHTLYFPFFLFYLHCFTYTSWKNYAYFILYAVVIVYFIFGGYYAPRCILPSKSSLLLNGSHFLSVILLLTDLLLSPKRDHFKFQLRICITFMIFTIFAAILTSAQWTNTTEHKMFSDVIFNLHFLNSVVLYYVISLILLLEIIKLRKKEMKNA